MRRSCRFAMAVHVLALLAYHADRPVTSHFLANSVNTNPVIIRRLLLILQKAKLVETRKGAGFGTKLIRPPAEIDLAEVFRAVEDGAPFPMPSRKPSATCPVGHCIQSALQGVFSSAQEALINQLMRTTMADILHNVRACTELPREGVPNVSR